MKSAEYVSQQAEELKKSGKPLQYVAWLVALLCVGWAYVFGARGELCSPANRRAYYKSKGASHPTIKSKCPGFDSGSCSGCKWYPGSKRTKFFDCRGFTYWVLLQVFGWKLQGAGATSQWKNEKNWAAKGPISTMPKDRLVCLFVANGSTMSHTGFGYNDETVECSSGVQHFTKRAAKWTHWAVPSCCDESYKPPEKTEPKEPKKEETKVSKATIRRGSKGAAVKELQTLLQELGYDLGPCGVDSDFGKSTEAAVKAFQKTHGLNADGVVGVKTWAALETASKAPKAETYKVTISGQTKAKAEEICKAYKGAIMEVESNGR